MEELDDVELALIDVMDDLHGYGFKELAARTDIYDLAVIRKAIHRLTRKGYVHNKKNDKSYMGTCEKYGSPGLYVLNNVEKVWLCKERNLNNGV